MAFLSDNWGLVCQLMFDNRERNKQNCNGEARPVELEAAMQYFKLKENTINPMLKDKGK